MSDELREIKLVGASDRRGQALCRDLRTVPRGLHVVPSFSSTPIIWGFSHGCCPPEWDAILGWDSAQADLAPSVPIAIKCGGGRACSQG